MPTQPASNSVERKCPVCGGGARREHLRKGELRLVRCVDCSMIYANRASAGLATGRFYDEVEAAYYLSPAKLESDYAAVRFERELRMFRRHCRGGSVLDVGCSSGAFLHQLKRRFSDAYEVMGTDVSGPALDYAESRGVTVRRGGFLDMDFAGRQFEAVTFWAVLEHLLEPGLFLQKARAILKPGGYCFVLVPNANSLAMRLLGARYRYVLPQHLNYFSRGTIAALGRAWFSLVELKSTHFNPLVLWQDWRRGGAQVPDEARAELLARTTAWKQKPWLWPAAVIYRLAERALGSMTLADNLIAVLRKPV